MNDKVLPEYLFAIGATSPVNTSVHTWQYRERTIKPITLSHITSYRGTEPEELNHRRTRKEAEMSTAVAFVAAKSQTRHHSATNGEPLGKV